MNFSMVLLLRPADDVAPLRQPRRVLLDRAGGLRPRRGADPAPLLHHQVAAGARRTRTPRSPTPSSRSSSTSIPPRPAAKAGARPSWTARLTRGGRSATAPPGSGNAPYTQGAGRRRRRRIPSFDLDGCAPPRPSSGGCRPRSRAALQEPHVSDPRTGGEIISRTIGFCANISLAPALVRGYFTQAERGGRAGARCHGVPRLADGKLWRTWWRDEVGRTLGLPHNMLASSGFPVDLAARRELHGASRARRPRSSRLRASTSVAAWAAG